MADDRPPDDDAALESREPTVEDLRDLCRALNERGARYIVIGGFAIRAAGYNRRTMDVDLLVAGDPDNEARVVDALMTLPDQAVRDLQPGELQQYSVIRVADEILVDLMRLAGGIDYAAAATDVVVRNVDGVPIPFASPRLLWRMKAVTGREKDAGDLADRGRPARTMPTLARDCQGLAAGTDRSPRSRTRLVRTGRRDLRRRRRSGGIERIARPARGRAARGDGSRPGRARDG